MSDPDDGGSGVRDDPESERSEEFEFDPDPEVDREAFEGEEEAEDGWRFGLDDVGEEGIVRPSIEPGRPTRENAAFVVLGAVATLLVFFRLWTLLG